MIKNPHDLILINGVALPPPVRGYELVTSRVVDSGRNANGAVVGQLVGRKLYKLNNLQWKGLDAETWSSIQRLLEPFFVNVTFTNEHNERITLKMYPGDTAGQPYQIDGVSYELYESCKFNLIDCGE